MIGNCCRDILERLLKPSAWVWVTLLPIAAGFTSPPSGLPTTSSRYYWVRFADKGIRDSGALQSALSAAAAELSEYSLRRRAKVRQVDLVDVQDLPVFNPYVDSVAVLTGKPARSLSRWLNAASFDLSPSQVVQVRNLSFVADVFPVAVFRRSEPPVGGLPEPVEPRRDHDYDYGPSIIQNTFLNIPDLHDRGLLGSGVRIGVTDAGFNNLDHNCFQDLEVLATWDFVNDDEDVGDGEDQGDGSHGTRTLSVLAGFDPGNLVGVAPQASYLLAKTENTEVQEAVEEDYWVEGLEWLERLGADIVSVSLGYGARYQWEDLDGDHGVTTIAADRAVALGVLVVASAGNSGNERHPHNKVATPADGDSVIAVGALNRDSTRAAFSSIGPTYDGRIKPDFAALGVNVVVASDVNDERYVSASGTSFSAPALAGLCALLLQNDPSATPMVIREVLRNAANRQANPDTLVGWGIPDGLRALEVISQRQARLRIALAAGWNLVSLNVVPPEVNIPALFEPLRGRVNLILVKDDAGRYYRPLQAQNDIPDWQFNRGYYVLTVRADTLTVSGIPVAPNRPIPVHRGWQIIPYLPVWPMSPAAAFGSLVELGTLRLVRDDLGRFYCPEFNFSNMAMLKPGEAYVLKASEDGMLVYPRRPPIQDDDPSPSRDLQYFQYPPPGEIAAHLIFQAGRGVRDGMEVEIADETGTVRGAGRFHNGRAGVTVWLDDFAGEPSFRLLAAEGASTPFRISWVSGEFPRAGELAVGEMEIMENLESTTTPAFVLSAAPNPFNGALRLTLNSRGGPGQVAIYDAAGRQVLTKDLRLPVGSVNLPIALHTLPTGYYTVRVTIGADAAIRRVVLLR